MQIKLSDEANEFIRRAVETGRHHRAEDAVREALELWVERERHREELLTDLDMAEAELAHEEGIELTQDSMRELFEDVKRRGRARYAGAKRASG